MSVLCSSSAGWLLDELLLVNTWYQHGGGLLNKSQEEQDSPGRTYRFREDLFFILKPHIATPSPLTPAATSDPLRSGSLDQGTITSEHKKAARKKRARSTSLNSGEVDALLYHKKISDLISGGSLSLINEGFEKGFLHSLTGKEDEKSEQGSNLNHKTCGLAELCDMAKHMPTLTLEELHVHVLSTGNACSQDTDFLSHLTENQSEWPQCISLLGEKYLIPPRSSFLLSDITCIHPLLKYKKFNVIVVDPPWENKSVKRSKSYSYLSPGELKQLPIPALADSECLVVTWVTNRQKHLRFVKEELYPHWSVRTITEWHWVKITKSGELVFPLDSQHKKPYEILVLGKIQNLDNSTLRIDNVDLPAIPQHKLIVSVPCKLHSHKPPLSEPVNNTGSIMQAWASVMEDTFLPLGYPGIFAENKIQRCGVYILSDAVCNYAMCPLLTIYHQCGTSDGDYVLGDAVHNEHTASYLLHYYQRGTSQEILKEFVTPDAECLEMFARNLQPGWTSWGNEVLKFQHLDYFSPIVT